MEQINHQYVQINGLKIHFVEIGSKTSPAVVFLHGFPEIWYSWRHQMIAIAKSSFRAITPDCRGYGLSDQPSVPENTTFSDCVADVLALLDALSIPKDFVGKDFGSMILNIFAFKHPQRLLGVVTLGVPFMPPTAQRFHDNLPEGFYASRWEKPGRAEADFGRLDDKTVVRNVYILFSRSEIPIAQENQEIMDMVDSSTPLPEWFTEEDLDAYGALYQKSSFRTALKVPYRSFSEEFNLTNPNPKVDAPALFIMGEKDYCFKFPGMEDYIKNEGSKAFYPKLHTMYIPEGSHFVQEQFPEKVNSLILNFLKAHL